MIYKNLTVYFCANKQVMYKKGKLTVLASNIADGVFSSAFTNCTSLTLISFPNLITLGDSVFSSAFTNCTSLTLISFPKLTSVGSDAFSSAFSGCTNLTSVSLPKLTSVSSSSFKNIGHSNLTIHVPSSLSSAELSTGGSDYGTIVYDL